MEICKQQSEIKIRHLQAVDRFKRYGRYFLANFLDQSIGIDEKNVIVNHTLSKYSRSGKTKDSYIKLFKIII